MFQVYQERCMNCLFGKERIVSTERAKEIIETCKRNQTHFVCHVSTIENNGNICCRGFYDTFGDEIDKIQIAKRLDLVEFVVLPETEQLPPFRDLS